jgi:diguanylate cyclase (GGDEF)-like protein
MLKTLQTPPGLPGSAPSDIPAAAGAMRQFPALRRFWWAAIFLLGTSVGAVGWTIWQLRNDAIQAAVSDSGNIATILAGQLSRSINSIDAMLRQVAKSHFAVNSSEIPFFRQAHDKKETYDALRTVVAELPHVFNLAVTDADGRLVVSTAAWPTPKIDVSDREHFIQARAGSDSGLITSVPIRNRIDGSETIVFSRRLESPDGTFAGIVFASVNTSYFEAIYGSTHSVRNLIFNLIRPDGMILFRHPDPLGLAGRKLSAEAEWQNVVAKGSGSFRILAKADGNVRYVSVRGVPGYPLFVNMSITEGTALTGWLRRSAAIGVGSIALLLCSVYLLIAFTRQVRLLGTSEASLRQKSRQLDAALNNMSQGLSMFDREQRLVVSNEQYAALYELDPEQLKPGEPLSAILAARAAAGTDVVSREELPQGSGGAGPTIPEARPAVEELKDGRVISITRRVIGDGGWVSMHQDITAQRQVEAQLARMARYDSLTGLPNRAMFLERAADALARMRQMGEHVSVLMIDLDNFKEVNDSLGHATGDALLKAVADRLQHMIRNRDTAARLGGDEFAIIQIDKGKQRDGAAFLADGILEAITAPYEFDGRQVIVGTSIGITLAPQDADDIDALIRNADLALYKAKSEGRNRYRFYEPSMEVESRDRRELEQDIRQALARDEFELHYQTIIDVARQQCCGAEALVRWRHPKRGLLCPDQFIPLAEENGLIVPLGAWILRRACADAARWPSHLRVAVNLSPRQFTQNDLPGDVRSALAESGLDAPRLELEITETMLLEKNEENLAALREVKTLGVAIVLDDFGIGYSSMRYLQMMSFDRIKIDRSFVQSMPSHRDSVAIVCAIVGLAQNLGIATTAEGVETTEQYDFVRRAGCELAQGFLFSRPVPASELSFVCPGVVLQDGQTPGAESEPAAKAANQRGSNPLDRQTATDSGVDRKSISA